MTTMTSAREMHLSQGYSLLQSNFVSRERHTLHLIQSHSRHLVLWTSMSSPTFATVIPVLSSLRKRLMMALVCQNKSCLIKKIKYVVLCLQAISHLLFSRPFDKKWCL